MREDRRDKTPSGDPGQEPEISYAAEVRRKLLHLVALIVPLFMALAGRELSLRVLVPLALFALLMDGLRARFEPVARLVATVFGSMMRASEISPVGDRIRINGASWVLVTASILAILFPMAIAVPVFVTFMIGDAAAALVGRRFGRHRWPGTPRTVEGSAAFFAVGLIVVALFPQVPFWAGAVSVLFAAAAEVLPRPLNDNLRVPLVAGLVLLFLERYVLGWPVSLLFW